MDDEPLFFNQRDGPYFPTLRLLHKYPDMMPKLRVDKGGLSRGFRGKHHVPGQRTSAGVDDSRRVRRGRARGHLRGGKEHALAIGITKMSTADIKSVNKGIGVDLVHYLNARLWKVGDAARRARTRTRVKIIETSGGIIFREQSNYVARLSPSGRSRWTRLFASRRLPERDGGGASLINRYSWCTLPDPPPAPRPRISASRS